MFPFIKKHKFISDSVYPYHEFAKENANTVFCKISKSSTAINKACDEPWFYDYKPGTVAIDTNPDGNYGFSFVPLSHAIAVLRYGDTYTEFSFDKKDIKAIPKNEVIKWVGNIFNEYKAKQLYVKRQMSLADVKTHIFLIKNASPEALKRTLIREYSPLSIEKHMRDLGFKEAEQFWHNINQQFKQIKLTPQYMEFALDLKAHPEKYQSGRSLADELLR